jgi:hypothetical protein
MSTQTKAEQQTPAGQFPFSAEEIEEIIQKIEAQGGALDDLERRVKAEIQARKKRNVRVPLTEEEREGTRARLMELSDNRLVATFMTGEKMLERHATGKAYTLAQYQTVITGVLLGRFIPGLFLDELAVWAEHDDDGGASDA